MTSLPDARQGRLCVICRWGLKALAYNDNCYRQDDETDGPQPITCEACIGSQPPYDQRRDTGDHACESRRQKDKPRQVEHQKVMELAALAL